MRWPQLIICLFILVFSAASIYGEEEKRPPAEALDVEELKRQVSEEASSELAAIKLGDTDVSLQVAGYWKGSLRSSLGLSFGPLGTQVVSPDTPLLFSQEADLTVSLWVRNRWFLEANFLDDYDVNTYRVGYQGMPGKIVQYAGIGNTGLDFPSFPYLDLGGDSPSSFGYYGRFGGRDLSFHTLFRWDQAAREERVFVGGRERTYVYLSPVACARGISFVLPDTNIDSEPQVYFEDEKGELRDDSGRRWRLAGQSEYAAGRIAGLLELNRAPTGMVALAYSKGGSRPWDVSLGSYGDPPALIAGKGFLGEAQDYFWAAKGEGFKLADYPQCGAESTAPDKPGSRTINGKPVLILYEPGTFSPFERRSRYEAPSSASEEAALVTLSSSQRLSGFELVPFEGSILSADIPLYAASEIKRGFFELIKESGGTSGGDRRSPESRWPLAFEYAQVYVPGLTPFTSDLSLRFTNYSGSDAYAIGTDLVPGSIQVWRSGLLDPQFSYNAAAGTVSLTSPAGFSEIIRITYLKRSSETRLGSVAAGLGAVYHREESPFSSELALGLRWNLNTGETYTEEGASNPGTVGLSAKTAWDFDRFKAQITAGLGFEQPDSSGLYRVAGMEGNEIAFSLAADAAFASHPLVLQSSPGFDLELSDRADLVYRNYRDASTLANMLMPVGWDGSRLVPGENRPYPVRDPELSTKANVLAAEFTLDNAHKWAAYEVPLAEDASLLAMARELEIPFRFYDFNGTPPADFRLLLQLGSLSGKDFAFTENPALILEKVLYDGDWNINAPPNHPSGNPAAFGTGARIAHYVLSDSDRLKLADAKYLRIIAVHGGAGPVQGRVLLAPPIARGASFRPIAIHGDKLSASGSVQAAEIHESGPGSLERQFESLIRRLHPSGKTQQVLSLSWENMPAGDSAGADGRIGALPLSNYRALSFFVKGPAKGKGSFFDDGTGKPGGTLSFVIASGPGFVTRPDERFIEAEIPLSAFQPGKWSKVSIFYQGQDQGLVVDGSSVPGSRFLYRKLPVTANADLPAGKSLYAAVYVNPKARDISADSMSGEKLPDGTFCIDEIILEEAIPLYRLNGGARAEYRLEGTLLAIGKVPVLADLSLSSALESELRGDPFTSEREMGSGLTSRSSAGISLLGTKIKGNLALTAANRFFWNAGHEVSRSFGPFSLEGHFSASPEEKTLDHRFNANLSSAFRGRFEAQAIYDEARFNRKWNLSLGYDPPSKPGASASLIPSLGIDASAAWASKPEQIKGNESYGELWLQSWRPMLPDLGEGAEGRETTGRITISEKPAPLGAALMLEGKTAFLKANNITRPAYTASLELPLVLGSFSANFKIERGFKRSLLFSGNDVLDEARKLGESISDSLPLWEVPPLYSLFAPELNAAMDKGLSQSPSKGIAEYASFNDLFRITSKFPRLYNLKALFIPANASLGFERIMERKLDTDADTLHIKGKLGFSAINMFGAFGFKPLFKFYKSDELSHTLEAALGIPREEEPSWRLQWAAGASLRGFLGEEFGLSNTATVLDSGWMESLRADWTFPAKKSLLSALYDWTASKARLQSSWLRLSLLMNKPYEKLLKESLELSFDHSGDYLNWDLALGHESIIRIMGLLYFSVFAKLNCSQQGQSKTLSFVGSVGTNLNIFF